MTAGEAIEVAALAEGSRVIGRVETDFFCAGCQYNLHGLDVWRDSRLEIAVVRCPECGKFHAAGVVTGAGRVWLSRLGTFLVSLWVLAILVGIAAAGVAMMIVDTGQMEAFASYDYWGRGPRVITLRSPLGPDDWWEQLLLQYFFYGLSGMAGSLLGAGGAICLSHLKRGWLLLLALVPVLAMATVYVLMAGERGMYARDYGVWVTVQLLVELLIQCVGIIAGITFGRKFARSILRAALSRKLLQYVHVLWYADGLEPPGTTSERTPA